jgi:hypothetical protein
MDSQAHTKPADSIALWRATEVGELIALDLFLTPRQMRDCLVRNLSACIESTTSGNLKQFRQFCGLNPWDPCVPGKVKPMLDQLLCICHALGISLAKLFTEDFETPVRPNIRPVQPKADASRASSIRLNRIKSALQGALKESPAPSLPEVARRLGNETRESLKKAEPVLSQKVIERYNRGPRLNPKSTYGMERLSTRRSVERRLTSSLASKSAESVGEIASSLGHKTEATLRCFFSKLCDAIDRKIKRHKVDRLAQIEKILVAALELAPAKRTP